MIYRIFVIMLPTLFLLAPQYDAPVEVKYEFKEYDSIESASNSKGMGFFCRIKNYPDIFYKDYVDGKLSAVPFGTFYPCRISQNEMLFLQVDRPEIEGTHKVYLANSRQKKEEELKFDGRMAQIELQLRQEELERLLSRTPTTAASIKRKE